MTFSLNVYSFLLIFCGTYGLVKGGNIVICKDTSHAIDCGCNNYIFIESAKWGRENQDTCGHNFDVCTVMEDKTSTIKSWCEGKPFCQISVSDAKFGTPCPNWGSLWGHYMRVRYRCIVKNECSSNPCKKGTCIDGLNRYTCVCSPGYYGSNCQYDINECQSNPCFNGNCSNNVNSYKCVCKPGYTGINCEKDINECKSNPCHHGNCSNNINNYKCDCDPGYTGVNCEVDIDECQSYPCLHGNCTNNIDYYKCFCDPGYIGVNCEHDIDECLSSPCLHGTCVSHVNRYECLCSWDAFGVNCENSILDYTVPITAALGTILILMTLVSFYLTSELRKISGDLEDYKMSNIMRLYNEPDFGQAKSMFEVKNMQKHET